MTLNIGNIGCAYMTPSSMQLQRSVRMEKLNDGVLPCAKQLRLLKSWRRNPQPAHHRHHQQQQNRWFSDSYPGVWTETFQTLRKRSLEWLPRCWIIRSQDKRQ